MKPDEAAGIRAVLKLLGPDHDPCRQARLARVPGDGRVRCGAEDTPDEHFGPCHQTPGHGGHHQDYYGYCWPVAT